MSLIRELVAHFGLSAHDFMRLIQSAPARYKVYDIPKRNGGTRTIAQPAKELKAVQRFVVKHKLNQFSIHAAAMGYVKGRNIRDNALVHKNGKAILKLDFAQFFPSIQVNDWERFVREHPAEGIEHSDIKLYSKILFWGQHRKSSVPICLSIGAPSSPALSNILLFDLDSALTAKAEECDVRYTRYADDITASADTVEKVQRFAAATRRAVARMRGPKLTFNEEKCGLYLRGQRRMVTGLIITPTREVSIGRARKRVISAMLHRSSLDRLNNLEKGHLKGLLGFCLAIEPIFVERMRVKYGDEMVDAVLKFRALKRRELEDRGAD